MWTVQGKVAPGHAMNAYKGAEVQLHSFLSWVVIFTPRLLYVRERTPISIELEAGVAPEPIWTVLEKRKIASPFLDSNPGPSSRENELKEHTWQNGRKNSGLSRKYLEHLHS